ncbi:MAG: RagB/SusD family nutrient uptake outer membrane protein [Chitinophagaceae bacterium]|nr:RagB/SusD family nutrient uptake outer membrane protein [Chitinophagaceae bacterium]
MKNKLVAAVILLTVSVTVGLTGCKKFLDRKPLTATLDDLNQGAEAQVLGMYSYLRGSAGFSTLPWIDFHSIRDDDAQKGSDASDGAEVNTEFETFVYTKDDWATNEYWNNHYSMVNLANQAIGFLDSLNSGSDVATRNYGEACFFRAYAYFELVKTYGEVPLFKQEIKTAADGIRPKSPITDIYAFIDSNLQVAAANLPANADAYGTGGQYKGRLTSGSAKTLLAQAHLFRQNWAQVVSLCNQVIASGEYELLPEFSNIWRDGVSGMYKNSKESIFEMQAHTGAGAQSNGAVYFGSDWGTCQQVRRNGAPVEWNLGWGWNTPTQKLVDAWPVTDPRRAKTILFSGQSDGGSAAGGFGAVVPAYTNPDGTGGLAQRFWNKKLYTGNDPADRALTGFINNNGAAPWINHRILRYADVILMLAEASNELGNGAVAEANLELIRNRASGGLGAARTVVPKVLFVSQAQMRTAIKAERRWEFAMEGYRFYDLVRWGDAVAELGALGYTDRCKFYPIPQKAIDLSGNVLVQNPQW